MKVCAIIGVGERLEEEFFDLIGPSQKGWYLALDEQRHGPPLRARVIPNKRCRGLGTTKKGGACFKLHLRLPGQSLELCEVDRRKFAGVVEERKAKERAEYQALLEEWRRGVEARREAGKVDGPRPGPQGYSE